MLDAEKKQQILEQFSAYLDTTPEINDNLVQTNEPKIDLYRLFKELAALKTEVKIESRQVKTAIEEFQVLTERLQKNNQQLSDELTEQRRLQVKNNEEVECPLLLALLDLRDRMEAGITQANHYQPGWFSCRKAYTRQYIQSLHEGMTLSLRRLDVLLDRYKVKHIDAIGMQLDPYTMQVSETDQLKDKDNGVVLLENRKGYLRNGQLLRLAEVTVNKIN